MITTQEPSVREMFDRYLDTAVQAAKRKALRHAIKTTSQHRAPTVGDVLECSLDSPWGSLDLEDITVGELLGDDSIGDRIADMLDRLLPELEVDPEDARLELPLAGLAGV